MKICTTLLLLPSFWIISACSSPKIVPLNFNLFPQKNSLTTPTCEEFGQIVRTKIAQIDVILMQHEAPLKKNKKWANGLTIGGSVVGLGGGLYGVFSNNEQKGAAVTSLLSGTVTGLVAVFSSKNNDRMSECIQYLNETKFRYTTKWSVCPKTPEEWKIFNDEQDQISNKLKDLGCFKTS